MTDLTIHSLVVPPLYSNCYILANAAGNAIVIDPGGIPDEIYTAIKDKNLNVQAIINTHGHVDHVSGNPALRRHTKAPVYIHEIDAPMLESPRLSGAHWAGLEFENHTADHHLTIGSGITIGDFKFDIHHTPGHCPGSVCLVMPSHKCVISGDLVFMGSIGRTDLPGGDESIMEKSLRWFITLPPEYTILPGHGAPTTVQRELATNPFLRPLVNQQHQS